MSLPASQYSVLDAERIERVDDNTFRCYVYRFKFFAFEICPVLLVRVEEQPNGCCIKLLSCKVCLSWMNLFSIIFFSLFHLSLLLKKFKMRRNIWDSKCRVSSCNWLRWPETEANIILLTPTVFACWTIRNPFMK